MLRHAAEGRNVRRLLNTILLHRLKESYLSFLKSQLIIADLRRGKRLGTIDEDRGSSRDRRAC